MKALNTINRILMGVLVIALIATSFSNIAMAQSMPCAVYGLVKLDGSSHTGISISGGGKSYTSIDTWNSLGHTVNYKLDGVPPGTTFTITYNHDGRIVTREVTTPSSGNMYLGDVDIITPPAPTVQFSTAGGSVNEGGSVTVTVTRSGDLLNPSTVTLNNPSGLPAGASTGPTFPATLTWGSGDSSPRTFTVNVGTNSVIDDAGSATFTLSDPTGCTLGTSTYTLTINDINIQSSVSFQGSAATVNEGGQATITIVRTGDTPGTFDVAMTTSGDSASLTAAPPTTISFGAADPTRSFTVNVKTDSVVQGDRTVIFTLTDGGGATLGEQRTYTLTIHDINQPYNPSTPTPTPSLTPKDKIMVHVHNSSGTPIVSASVTIGSQSLITDASGNTAVFMLDHGTPVNIRVSASGYDVYEKSYTPNGDATVDVTLVLTPTPTPTQTLTRQDTITVHVHNSSGTPIVSASVTIGSQSLITDAGGNATFLLDHGTPVDIHVSATGYYDVGMSFTPNGDATVDVTMVMTPAPEPEATTTENTAFGWWWLLLFIIPLAGVVIYYYGFVKEK